MNTNEKRVVTDVLGGVILPATHAALFDDDVVYLAVRRLEEAEPAWLQTQINAATSQAGRALVLSMMAQH